MNDTDAPTPAWGINSADPARSASDPGSENADATESVQQAPAPAAVADGRFRWAPAGIAALISALSLLLPLRWGGLWAPYELETAELARRIAAALHGVTRLELAGANNLVPTLTELGRGQLPLSSVALGFQLFGLHDWAGRLPLALWGLLGIAATFLLVSRLRDSIAATYASLALASMPLYFVQARTLLGDIVTLSAVALATSGLGLGTFLPGATRRAQIFFSVLGVLGLAAGFASRGVLFGVACPALGVGLGWLIWRSSGQRCPGRYSEGVGAFCLLLGAAALGAGLWVLLLGTPNAYLEVLGAHLNQAAKLPTHDEVLHQLGFGLFPWSALAPFGLAIALGKTPAKTAPGSGGQLAPEYALGVCLASVLAVSMGVHGLSAPYLGSLPFVGTFALAALLGIALREAETRAYTTRLVALGTAALLIVFLFDLRSEPEQSLLPFVVSDATFPESFARAAKSWLTYGAGTCLLLLALALGDLPSAPLGRLLAPDGEYMSWIRGITERWRGRLVWALLAVTFLLGTLPVLRWLVQRGVHIRFVEELGTWSRPLGYAFLVIPILVLAPLALWLARDLASAFLNWLPISRARLAVIALTGFGLALSLGYYPALAAHLSPRDVFGSYQARAHDGDPLAVLGPTAPIAPYYTGARVENPKSVRAGFEWLMAAPDERRWLVLNSKDLAQLNFSYRERAQPHANLPILDAISSQVLLASNQLAPGEHNDNPLAAWIASEAPQPQHPLDVDLNGQLRCLGWALTEVDGRPAARIVTGHPYEFRIYWEVTAPISGTWQTFIHIDGNHRRFNGDHDTLEGKYPFKDWLKGDYITDVHRVELEPQFSGATYQVYFGLFTGDKRLNVTRGAQQDNRIVAGSLAIY